MSQNYKIVERLKHQENWIRRYADGDDSIAPASLGEASRQIADVSLSAASLIQELGEALKLARPFLGAGVWQSNPDEVAVKVDAILSKLKET